MRHAAIALLLLALLPMSASAAAAPPVAATASAAPAEIVLHLKPQPGDKMRQTMDMTMQTTQSMLPGATTTDAEKARAANVTRKLAKGTAVRAHMAMRTEASEVDAQGIYLLHLRGEGGNVVATLADGEVKDLPNPMGALEVDAQLHTDKADVEILRVKSGLAALKDPKALDTLAESIVQQAYGALRDLDGRSLKIGDSAEIPFAFKLPLPLRQPGNAQLQSVIRFTLTSVRKGIAYFDTAVSMNMDIAPSDGAAQTMQTAMKGSGKGVLAYRIADRLPVRQDLNLEATVDLHLPTDVDMQTHVDSQVRIRAERWH